mgnify:CR=1 FL=1
MTIVGTKNYQCAVSERVTCANGIEQDAQLLEALNRLQRGDVMHSKAR